jgi:hypothetical protein
LQDEISGFQPQKKPKGKELTPEQKQHNLLAVQGRAETVLLLSSKVWYGSRIAGIFITMAETACFAWQYQQLTIYDIYFYK